MKIIKYLYRLLSPFVLSSECNEHIEGCFYPAHGSIHLLRRLLTTNGLSALVIVLLLSVNPAYSEAQDQEEHTVLQEKLQLEQQDLATKKSMHPAEKRTLN